MVRTLHSELILEACAEEFRAKECFPGARAAEDEIDAFGDEPAPE